MYKRQEVGDYRIKVYYCHDSECPITNWGLFGSFFFEYSDMHRLHDECNWKTFFYDNKHDLRDVIDAVAFTKKYKDESREDEDCEEWEEVDSCWGTQGFYRCNDAGTLPGECADFIFHKCND